MHFLSASFTGQHLMIPPVTSSIQRPAASAIHQSPQPLPITGTILASHDVTGMRDFPGESLLNVAQPVNRPAPLLPPPDNWPHRLATTTRFYHSSLDTPVHGPQTLEYQGQFLPLSHNERQRLNEYCKKNAQKIPEFNNFPHHYHDQLFLFFNQDEPVSTLKTAVQQLLGEGFNDKLWSHILKALPVQGMGEKVEQSGVLDITSIRNQAVQNSLAPMAGQDNMAAFFEFANWVKNTAAQSPRLMFMTEDSLQKAQNLIGMIEQRSLAANLPDSNQFPHGFAYGLVNTNHDARVEKLLDTGHIGAINEHLLAQQSNTLNSNKVLTAESLLSSDNLTPETAITEFDGVSLVPASALGTDSVIDPKAQYLVEIEAGTDQKSVSDALHYWFGNQIFSMEEHTLMSRNEWLNGKSAYTSMLDVSKFVDRVTFATLQDINKNEKFDHYRSMNEFILKECKIFNELGLYELSEVFLHEKTSEAMQESLAKFADQTTGQAPALFREEPQLAKVVNLVGRHLQHTSINTVWDRELTSPELREMAERLVEEMENQGVGLKIARAVNESITKALNI